MTPHALDRQIATQIMQWRWIQLPSLRSPIFMSPEQWQNLLPAFQTSKECEDDLPGRLPKYSTDLPDAFLVVERMLELGCCIGMESVKHGDNDVFWRVQFSGYPGDGHAEEGNLCQAICLAALATLDSHTGGRP